MLTSGLSTDQAPPISVPFSYFAAAPLLGMIAGAALIVDGYPQYFTSRWSPHALGWVHLVLPGFFVTVILGAMQQLLPVVGGATIRKPVLTGRIILALWLSGILSLVSGFYSSTLVMPEHPGISGSFFVAAAGLIGLAATIYLGAVADALLRSNSKTATVTAMKLSHASFAIGVILSLVLSLGHSGLIPLFRTQLTNIHGTFALVGWILILVAGVSYQVLPMFYMTGGIPTFFMRCFGSIIFGGLVLNLILTLGESSLSGFLSSGFMSGISFFLAFFLSAAVLMFGFYSLSSLYRRKRKVPDPAVFNWYMALCCMCFAVLVWFLHVNTPLPGIPERYSETPLHLAFFVFVFGFLGSALLAMLYKIIGFLVWFHLQAEQMRKFALGQTPAKIPTMKQILPDKLLRWHTVVHMLFFCVLVGSLVEPRMQIVAGIFMVLDFLLVEVAVVRGITILRSHRSKTQ